MVRFKGRIAAAVFAASISGDFALAHAQSPEPQSMGAPTGSAAAPGVTIVAPKTPPDVTGRQLAHEFIQTHSAVSARTGQLTRWKTPICPTVLGLPGPYAAFISNRIATVAKDIGASMNTKANCPANVLIIFSPAPQITINQLAVKRPDFLGQHYAADAKAIATVTSPVQAWYGTNTRDVNGNEWNDVVNTEITGDPDPGSGANGVLQAISAPVGCAHSRLSVCLSSSLSHVLILVDAKIAAGMQIGQLADYITMMSLAQIKLHDQCSAADDILNLFVAGCGKSDVPDALTAADIDYLHALYSTDLEAGAAMEKDELANRIAKDFAVR